MGFNSWIFWKFFSIVFLIYVLAPKKSRWGVLLGGSLIFCGFHRPFLSSLLLAPAAAVYLAALALEKTDRPERRRLLVWTGVTVPLAFLLFFKYSNFLGATVCRIAGVMVTLPPFRPLELVLPVGISFFTFRLLSYLIDVYQRHMPAERHAGLFVLYISFFPQLMAGPIERAKTLLPQLRRLQRPGFDSVVAGCQLVMWGLFKKLVVADRLSFFVTEVLRQPDGQGVNTLFALYFYTFEIYCDFSGYSDIAIGTARMLGITTQINFNFPYFSRTISEFWTRWHISLSTWLRDYLFLPLSYAVMRRIEGERFWGLKTATWGYAGGMLLTMMLCGLWHGAGWNFIVWGLLHGLFLVLAFATKKVRRKAWKALLLARFPRFQTLFAIIFTFHLITLAWVFFRFKTIWEALYYLSRLSLAAPGGYRGHLVYNIFLLLVFIVLEILQKRRAGLPEAKMMPLSLRLAGLAILAVLTIFFSVDASNEFIYFKF
jgi:alginate O-acetyltransferase complex protein AlgI